MNDVSREDTECRRTIYEAMKTIDLTPQRIDDMSTFLRLKGLTTGKTPHCKSGQKHVSFCAQMLPATTCPRPRSWLLDGTGWGLLVT